MDASARDLKTDDKKKLTIFDINIRLIWTSFRRRFSWTFLVEILFIECVLISSVPAVLIV